MPRKKREFIENGFYHIMTRGNDKRQIFFEERDYRYFILLLKKYLKKYNIKMYNFAIMPNHFHLLISAEKKIELANYMKCVNLSYGTYFRKKYMSVGYLYQGRYKSIIVENNKYLLECARYIEYNPVKAGLIEKVEEYRWSSIRYYIFNEYKDLITENLVYSEIKKNNDKDFNDEYLNYVNNSKNEKRSEERLFKEKIYGSLRFKKELEANEIKSQWSHSGRPKKFRRNKENEENK